MHINSVKKCLMVFRKPSTWYHQHIRFSSSNNTITTLATKITPRLLLCTTDRNKNLFKPLSTQASTQKDENQPSVKPNVSSQHHTQFNNISRFYEGSNVLITGSTGFLGKVLVERLLSTCNPDNVYLIIRPKKGASVEERTKQLLESAVFNKLKETDPKKLQKVKVFYGDLEQPNVGLKEAERHMILDKANIVLHTAANIKFTEKLQNILVTNTLGTKRVTELCKQMKHLKSLVHVSTTFKDKLEVDEVIYDPPYDPDFMIDLIQTMPADVIESITSKLLKRHPNSYTFSKELAEKYVSDCSSIIPAAIVRPSIVHSSWKEPFPGWIDSMVSSTGIAVPCILGKLGIIKSDGKIVADFIPVDVVADTIITAAWHTATYRSDKVKIYNCSSGQINSITLKESYNFFCRFSRENPTKHVLLYPGFTATTNRVLFNIAHPFINLIPAYIYDIYLYCNSRKPKAVQDTQATAKLTEILLFALFGQRIFQAKTFKSLIEAVAKAEDGDKFNLDMRPGKGFDWKSYMKDYMLGIRRYILKDDLSTLPYAKAKLDRIYWTTKAVQLISLGAGLTFLAW